MATRHSHPAVITDDDRQPGPRAALDARWAADRTRSVLRFLTCGSVDDGKSTLIGRLLYDSRSIPDDQRAALIRDSAQTGNAGTSLDYSLLLDGLEAEREQGITIDVAYRYFATDRRAFIVADSPGHVQYTRNMVTGASTADLAIILVDARKGVLEQTRRHSFLAHLLGVRRFVLAVNKMDLVAFSASRFDEVVAEYRELADAIGITEFAAIPLSGLAGDNVTQRSDAMPWYTDESLLSHLETATLEQIETDLPFTMPVQWVNRPDATFRGYAGRITGGVARSGDEVVVLPAKTTARIERIVTHGSDLAEASTGQSITLTFDREIDCSRGDLIVAASAPADLSDRLIATLVSLGDASICPGDTFYLKLGTLTVGAIIERIDHVIDMNALDPVEGRFLSLNDVGQAVLRLDRAVTIRPYADDRALGRFILIDRITNDTAAAGMVIEGLPPKHVVGVEDRILWVVSPRPEMRTHLLDHARKHLAANGEPYMLLDRATVDAELTSDLGDDAIGHAERLRRTRIVARMIAATGTTVLLETSDERDATPGQRIDELWSEIDGGAWVI